MSNFSIDKNGSKWELKIDPRFNKQNNQNLLNYTLNSQIDDIGLRRILDFVSDLKKPLIVHNGIMDILYVKLQFI